VTSIVRPSPTPRKSRTSLPGGVTAAATPLIQASSIAFAGMYRLKSTMLCSPIAANAPMHAIAKNRLSASPLRAAARQALLTTEPISKAPVVLVLCVDLKVVASIDQDLTRVGVISGASIYPFAWNILMGARHEGYGGTITTLATAQEPKIQELLGLPGHVAVCAVMPLGRPVQRLTRLKRKPVGDFAMRERWGGPPLA